MDHNRSVTGKPTTDVLAAYLDRHEAGVKAGSGLLLSFLADWR
ncbi:hypothetical protein ACFOHY_15235 [Rhizobium rosettiformans]